MSQLLFFQPFHLTFISSLLLLLFIFHIPSASAQILLFVECDNTAHYTNTSTFGTNLNLLLPSLSSNSSLNNGFYNASIGQDPNKAYGLVLCRGDVQRSDCENCIKTASDAILSRCPNRSATIWYDICLLRYSNSNFLSSSNTPKWHHQPNLRDVTNPDQFGRTLGQLMKNLSKRAVSEPRLRMFAKDQVIFDDFRRNIYGLVQCIRSISANECYSCFEDAISQIPACCAGKEGGKVVGAVCNVRYELYRFYGESTIEAPAPPPVDLVPPSTNRSPPTNETTTGSRDNSSKIIAILVPTIAIAAILSIVSALIILWKSCSRRKKAKTAIISGLEESEEFLQIDFNTVRAATNDFSNKNKLGEGGFGPVYKGCLPNGQDIAVKRLSINSRQGAQEFKNEVALVAKLQHRNLVRLLGCCVEGGEKLLIYEYVPKRSLDYFLFDKKKRASLNWECRCTIIGGIVRGLLYLHEDSRLKIVHRDLKASNILLDANMNPKISDFGMAKIFGVDQTQDNTSKIAGTYGYMPPEYAIYGQFSVKSDVFSFGVLLLEIVTGQRNNDFYQSDCHMNLLSNAWSAWNDGTILEIVDPIISERCSRSEAMRCIHVALLCVQEDATARPFMSSVALMLNSSSFILPAPSTPAFFIGSTTEPSFQTEHSSHTNHSDPSSKKLTTVSTEMRNRTSLTW